MDIDKYLSKIINYLRSFDRHLENHIFPQLLMLRLLVLKRKTDLRPTDYDELSEESIFRNTVAQVMRQEKFFEDKIVEKYAANLLSTQSYRMIQEILATFTTFDEIQILEIFDAYVLRTLKIQWGAYNKEIVRLMAKVLGIESWYVYSPTLWNWQIFTDIHKTGETKCDYFWQEINESNYLLAKIGCYMHELKAEILLNGFEEDAYEWAKFDYGVAIPPFNLKLRRSYLDGNNYFMDKLISHLGSNGKWAIVLPLSSTFKSTARVLAFRKNLIRDGIIESIILLPRGSFRPYTGVDTVLWIFNNKYSQTRVFFIDGRNSNTEEIGHIFQRKDEVPWISRMVQTEEIANYHYNCNPGIYINGIEKEIETVDESVQRYLGDIQRYPRTDREECIRLWRLIRRGDSDAKKILAKSNLALVTEIAEDYKGKWLEYLDLIQEWNTWLFQAVESYNPEGEEDFVSYASPIIRQSMLSAIEKREKAPILLEAYHKFKKELTREPTLEELSKNLSWTMEEVTAIWALIKTGTQDEILIQEESIPVVWQIPPAEEDLEEYISEYLEHEEKEQEELIEQQQSLKELQASITRTENEQKGKNLENITKFNDDIHDNILKMSSHLNASTKWYSFYPRYFYKKIFKDWSEQTKNSMRLSNIISLNYYIYDNAEKKKTENQFQLVKYFDEHLEKEWKLETRKSYANKLFVFLVIESIILLGFVYYGITNPNESILNFIKIFVSAGLLQITGMVFSIVKYLFPVKESKKTEEDPTSTTTEDLEKWGQ